MAQTEFRPGRFDEFRAVENQIAGDLRGVEPVCRVRRRFPVEQPHALTVVREPIGEIAREAVVLRFGI